MLKDTNIIFWVNRVNATDNSDCYIHIIIETLPSWTTICMVDFLQIILFREFIKQTLNYIHILRFHQTIFLSRGSILPNNISKQSIWDTTIYWITL